MNFLKYKERVFLKSIFERNMYPNREFKNNIVKILSVDYKIINKWLLNQRYYLRSKKKKNILKSTF